MRFRFLRRRLTISRYRVAVRSSVPWPVRWAVIAIVLGFCASISLWAFEFGKGIAGLDSHSRAELLSLREEVSRLREERDRAQSVANTSGSLLTAERATQERLLAQVRQLEQDNRSLRDDLGFFEKLIPAAPGSADDVAIRALQVDPVVGPQLRWQALVIQPVKGGSEFKGRLELTLSGTRSGKAWEMTWPAGGQALQFRQYRRLEGVIDLPADVVVTTLSARVSDGVRQRALQTVKL